MAFFQRLYRNSRKFLEKYGVAILPTILLTYYPNGYLHDVTRGSFLPRAKQRLPSDRALFVPALLIIGPLVYHVLSKYSLFGIFKLHRRGASSDNDGQLCKCADDSSKCSVHTKPIRLSETNTLTGLSSEEVSARRKIYGQHEAWKRRNWGLWILKFSSSASQVYIITGAVLAVMLHQWIHVFFILILWFLTAHMPAWQQYNADCVAESICPPSGLRTIVLRNAKLQEVLDKDLVPGDIVHVSTGATIPADCIVIAYDDLLGIDQSSITGENTPALKHENDTCYWGTGVVHGDAFLQVEHTGLGTFNGRILQLIQGMSGKSKEHKPLLSSKEYMVVLQLIGAIMMIVLGLPVLLWRTVSPDKSWPEVLSLTADMAIIAGKYLSTSTITSIRATSAARLSKSGCVPQNIEAVETLAGVDILCVDNTGIVTKNRFILVKPFCIFCDTEDVILAVSLSLSQVDGRGGFNRAIAKALKQFPQAKARRDRSRIIDHQDADSDSGRSYAQSLVEAPDGTRTFIVRGSPRAVLELCRHAMSGDKSSEKRFREAAKTFQGHGLASWGLAQRAEGGEWQLLGLLPFCDPPRQSTTSALRQFDELGVRVKLISGWAEALVEKIARVVGLHGPILHTDITENLQQDPSSELLTQIIEADAYTGLNISHKEMILTTLQNRGHRVAMTGDGKSDIPALRKADCAISPAGSTEAAQSASELTFLDKSQGLLPFVSAIQWSRRAFQHVHDYVVRQTVRTLHVLFTMLLVFMSDGKLLDMRLLLISASLVEITILGIRQKISDTPCPKRPVRWSKANFLKEVGWLVVILMSGSYLCAYSVPSGARLQALSLLLVIEDLWMIPLMHIDSRIWRLRRNLRLFALQLVLYLLITVACVTGWSGTPFHMSIRTAVQVWLYSMITSVTAGTVKYATSTAAYLESSANS